MSYSSKVVYEGDSVTTDFNVPMPYISTTHVSVYVNEILQLQGMNYNWTNSSTISFNTAPGIGAAIRIQRWTSPASTLVDFSDGSTLRADDLDTAYLHNYYLSQEYADSFNELINNALLSIAAGTGIVETETDEVIAALVNEMLAEAAAANLQARINDIDANAEAIITLGTGLQAQINTLAEAAAATVFVQADEPVPGVGGVPDPIPEGARWYDTDDNNKPYIYQSSAWVSINDPRVGEALADITALQVQTANTNAALVDEMFVRATETESLSQRFSLLGSTSADGSAFIVDLDTAKVSETESLADRFSQITADYTAADGVISAAVTAEETARANGDSALASTLALLGAENGGATAFILDTSTVKIDSDGGDTFATRLSALTAADDANSASISTIQSVTIPAIQTDVSDLESFQATAEAEYGVTLDVNGNVAGFKLIANGSGSSSFVVAAEKFAIADPGNPDLQPFTVSGNKIVMNGDVSVNGSLILNGTVVGSALVAGTIGSTQIGANAITTTQLNASAVTAAKIASNAVTADKINVTTLNSVTANTGDLTVSGTLTMGTSGKMLSSGTGFESGTGFFLGYDAGAYKFYVGNSGAGQYISWDGSTLTIRGDLEVGQYVVDASNALLSANTERSSLNANTWLEKKAFTMGKGGNVRVAYEIKRGTYSGSNMQSAQVRIKKNGVVQHTDTASTTAYVYHYWDLAVSADDDISVEIRAGEADPVEPVSYSINIQNCQIRGLLELTDGGSVDVD